MKFGQMAGVALIFGFVTIVLAIGGMLNQDLQTTVDADYGNTTAAHNVTVDSLDAITTFAGWLPLIGLVVAAAIIIGALGFFGSR